MRTGDTIGRTITLYLILKEKSDEQHLLSMFDLIEELSELGIKAERKSVYASIRSLNEQGYEVCFIRRNGKQGYYLKHDLTLAEAKVLCDAVTDSPALSTELSSSLTERIRHMLSVHQRRMIQQSSSISNKTQNQNVLQMIECLLMAIGECHPVEFEYYDITVEKEKKYRRDHQKYHLFPYAVISGGGRYYCVFYDALHEGFANYRIDKMENIQISDECFDTCPFDLDAWVRNSFDMYNGDPVTVTIEFDLNMASIVFDQFGTDILISKVTDTSFTANIRTGVSPTLIAWLVQFIDRSKVIKPLTLVDELRSYGEKINRIYGGDHDN